MEIAIYWIREMQIVSGLSNGCNLQIGRGSSAVKANSSNNQFQNPMHPLVYQLHYYVI